MALTVPFTSSAAAVSVAVTSSAAAILSTFFMISSVGVPWSISLLTAVIQHAACRNWRTLECSRFQDVASVRQCALSTATVAKRRTGEAGWSRRPLFRQPALQAEVARELEEGGRRDEHGLTGDGDLDRAIVQLGDRDLRGPVRLDDADELSGARVEDPAPARSVADVSVDHARGPGDQRFAGAPDELAHDALDDGQPLTPRERNDQGAVAEVRRFPLQAHGDEDRARVLDLDNPDVESELFVTHREHDRRKLRGLSRSPDRHLLGSGGPEEMPNGEDPRAPRGGIGGHADAGRRSMHSTFTLGAELYRRGQNAADDRGPIVRGGNRRAPGRGQR